MPRLKNTAIESGLFSTYPSQKTKTKFQQDPQEKMTCYVQATEIINSVAFSWERVEAKIQSSDLFKC